MSEKTRMRTRGYALIALLAVLVIGSLIAIGARLSATRLRLSKEETTTRALARAKEALLDYAAVHASTPGLLPCPDIGNAAAYEGSPKVSGSNCAAYIGRLPWKKLGLADLRDGAGECLWYAITPTFQDAGTHSVANGKAVNSTVSGTLNIQDDFGTATRNSPAIAVVFAPGAALPGQDRSNGTSHPVCGGNDTARNYLDAQGGIDNATGNSAGRFTAGSSTEGFNDRLIWIGSEEMFAGVTARIAGEIAAALKVYFQTAGALPYAAANPNTGLATPGVTNGFVPWYDLQPPPFIWALTGNDKEGWYNLVSYRRLSASSATLTLNGTSYDVSLP